MRLYRALTRVLEPLAGPALRLKAAGEGSGLREERLGFGGRGPVDLWFHAASLGEVAALRPLLAALHQKRGDLALAVTTSTASGRRSAEDLPGGDPALAPLDFPGAVGRAFDRRRPGGVVLVETELWPNFVLEAMGRGIPLAIVNGRVSDRTWPRYRRTRRWWRPLLQSFRAVAVRTEKDAARFRDLGVSSEALRVCGNLKHDGYLPQKPLELPWPRDQVVVCGSMHPQEAPVILPALRAVQERFPDLRIVVVPRHVDTASEWLQALSQEGFQSMLWSEDSAAGKDALVVDAYGLLTRAYASGSVALVGGSWTPVGGHNPVEAVTQGAPVLMGPYHHTVEGDVRALSQVGALRVESAHSGLASALSVWLEDPDLRIQAVQSAVESLARNRGAVERTLDWLAYRGVIQP